jgi:GntR family transcriptional regulator, rspAB operon transcriptional repressor
VRRNIVWLDFEPEKALNLTELAETFAVSRTPIKEAMLLLQSGGWVNRHGSHFVVAPLSLNLIKETAEIRYTLETQATLWAMERMTPEELGQLLEVKTQIMSLGKDADKRALIEIDMDFHHRIYAAAKNTQLNRMLNDLLDHYLRFWLWKRSPINRKVFCDLMLEILAAMESGDKSRLRDACTHHIKESVEEIAKVF